MDSLCRVSEEVFWAAGPVVCLGVEALEIVKQSALASSKCRARICAHSNTDDPVHEMLIALCRGGYVRPHKHLGKSESFHVVEGEGDIVLFTDEGEIQRVVRLGAPASGKDFYYRLSKGVYHTVIVRTELMVIHEVTNGPFRVEDTTYAPFAPSELDSGSVSLYARRLLAALGSHLQQNDEGR